MEELKEIYERMTFLRQKGIKMKDMAERAGFSPSVLSAIYSTVLPAYFKNLEKGMGEEEALHNALVWVNNVSKKKLLGSLARLKDSLFSTDYQAKAVREDTRCPFLAQLENNMQETMGRIFNFSGIYTSYSDPLGHGSDERVQSSVPDVQWKPFAPTLFVLHLPEAPDVRPSAFPARALPKALEALDEKEKMYYDYTCQAEDIIRMCNIPSPRMTEEDLIVEKKILSLWNVLRENSVVFVRFLGILIIFGTRLQAEAFKECKERKMK